MGILNLRFRIVSEEENFVIPFEANLVSQSRVLPKKKSSKWYRVFGKVRPGNGKQ